MPKLNSFIAGLAVILIGYLLINGCASHEIIKMPEKRPGIVKDFHHVVMPLKRYSTEYMDTTIHIEKGEHYSILSTYAAPFVVKIGNSSDLLEDTFPAVAKTSGALKLRYYMLPYADQNRVESNIQDRGATGFDIIVWRSGDPVQIEQFFSEMRMKNPKSKPLVEAHENSVRLKRVQMAKQKTK